MKVTVGARLCLALLMFPGVALAQQPKPARHPFDRDFINNHYSDCAKGASKAKAPTCAGPSL